MPSKRKPVVRAKAVNAKRRKTAKKAGGGSATAVGSEEAIRRLNEHVNMCVERVNLLMRHADFLQKKMYELANVTSRELGCFHFELEQLRSAACKTGEDAYGLYPSMATDTETTCISDENIMSEEMLIEAVGDFADSLP